MRLPLLLLQKRSSCQETPGPGTSAPLCGGLGKTRLSFPAVQKFGCSLQGTMKVFVGALFSCSQKNCCCLPTLSAIRRLAGPRAKKFCFFWNLQFDQFRKPKAEVGSSKNLKDLKGLQGYLAHKKKSPP